jgi:hypothetical protein
VGRGVLVTRGECTEKWEEVMGERRKSVLDGAVFIDYKVLAQLALRQQRRGGFNRKGPA